MVDASAVASAAKWLSSSLIQEGKYLYGVQGHVSELQKDLNTIQLLLQDVDENPSQDRQLLNFTQDMRELAFRAEDAIDTYVVDVGSKVFRKNLFLRITCLVSHSYPVHMLIKDIEAIQQEMQKAHKRFETFGSISKTFEGTRSSSSSRPPPIENYIHLDDEVVVGIDDDISHLVKRLIDPQDDFKVLAIVGTGGAGKTTLATQLYSHTQVESWFSYKAFVSISQKWSSIDVLQRILKEVKVGDVIPSSESGLVRELSDFLRDKQCLVVLDDMWKKEAWDVVCPILPHSKRGCRVIITTRIEEVPLYADSKCIVHEPKLLTEDQQWELFSKVAMEGRVGIEKNAEFEKLGRQMLGKCEGLPLAVVTLAGVLRTKKEWSQWEGMSKAYTEFILKGKGTPNYGVVEDMLALSYLDLPAYLKPCFLYLAIFLEDWIFPADTLIHLWIAEGFINDLPKGQETLEDAAMRLLEELAQRYIIQVTVRSIQGQIDEFRVHDLMREFCIKKAKDYQFVGTVSSTSPNVRGSRQPRRIAVSSRESYPQENNHLRTLFDLGQSEELPNGASENLKSIPNKFKLLRVLCIWNIEYVSLPKHIGKLIHLRFLSIIETQIFVLPKSIKNLRNLLYLVFETKANTDEVEVPDGLVENMENLRGLILPMSLKRGSLNRLGLRGPRNLQRLRTGAGTWMIQELPTLRTTVHDLIVYNIQKKEEMEALYQCSGIREDSLRQLRPSYYGWRSEEALEFSLEKLRDCRRLWDLDLDCPLVSNSKGTIIQFPPNLVRLYLARSKIKQRDDLMHVLGELPKLKYLSLSFGAYLGTHLSCTASSFPQLQELQLIGLGNLEEWRMEEGAMARLSKVWIDNCPKLKRLPECIRSITTLKELKVTEMPEEFCRRIGYGVSTSEAEDSYIIEHIPSAIVSCM